MSEERVYLYFLTIAVLKKLTNRKNGFGHVFCHKFGVREIYYGMKKYFVVFGLTVICLLTAIVLSACDDTVIGREYKRISDYRYASYRYECEDYTLDIFCGVRETPYKLDGKSAADKTPYTVFVVRPSAEFSFDSEELPLIASIDGSEYSVTLTLHPFRTLYSAEVPAAPTEGTEEFTANVCGAEVTAVNAPHSVDGEYALALALETLGSDVKGEICLRLTENTVTAESGWYWFVSVNDGENIRSVLISAESGEVKAVRNS